MSSFLCHIFHFHYLIRDVIVQWMFTGTRRNVAMAVNNNDVTPCCRNMALLLVIKVDYTTRQTNKC